MSDSNYGTNFEKHRLIQMERGEAETLVEAVEHNTTSMSLATLKGVIIVVLYNCVTHQATRSLAV
jgi:hypothetical protein